LDDVDNATVLGSRIAPFLNGYSEIIEKNIFQVQGLISSLASSTTNVSEHHITTVVKEAFIANDTKFNAESALRWANGFEFPLEVWSRDNAKLLELGNNFPALIRFRQNERKNERLNLNSVHNLNLSESVWKDRLLTIADGIPIITAPGGLT